MSDLDIITARRSYSGHTAEQLRKSARITAEAYGHAYIVVTKTTQQRVGGRVYVSSVPDPSWCAPTVVLDTFINASIE
jgi:hypothetical protein